MFDIDTLQKLLEEKYLVSQKHPQTDLWIYNYSQKTQFEGFWNEITLNCRGLILDKDYQVVARPFRKFFNLQEHLQGNLPEIPNESFEVFDKLDGSLGILYWLNDTPYIATRGSFNSEQAIKATQILHGCYQDSFAKLDRTKTYLFEIIYPENRIVVDYRGKEDLILLAIIDIATGQEMDLQDIGFQCVRRYNGVTEIEKLKELEVNNAEGFVIKFKNNFRVKLKFQEYIRLHRILTGVSNITVWEYLSLEQSFDKLLEKVPDEFYDWIKITRQNLLEQYQNIENEAKNSFKIFETRKETALYFQTQKHTSILFSMLDNKNYKAIIWKQIRPKFAKPFKNDEE
jgi:RNA ligase